jgi:phage gp29-like protein
MSRPAAVLRHHYTTVPQLSEWTPARVRAALREHERGQFRNSALLAEAMERNTRINAALQTRCLGLQGLPFCVEPADVDRRRAASVARALEASWWKIAPEEVLEELHRWAVLLGVAFAEVVWETRGGEWIPRLYVVHPYHVRWDDLTERYMVQTLDQGEVPIVPGDGWLVLSYASTRSWMRGVVRCLGMDDTIRTYAVRDWARWSEKHGLPVTGLVIPIKTHENDKSTAEENLAALGNESTVLLPRDENDKGYDLKYIEPKTVSWEGFQAQIERCASDIAIAINGQVGTTDTKGGGSFAAAKVHERVRADYLEADAALFGTATHEQINEPWAEYNTGRADLAPWCRWDATTPEDAAQVAETLKTVGEALGLWNAALERHDQEVDVPGLAARYGLPVVPLVKPVEPPPPAAPPGAGEGAPPEQTDARARAAVAVAPAAPRRWLSRDRRRVAATGEDLTTRTRAAQRQLFAEAA